MGRESGLYGEEKIANLRKSLNITNFLRFSKKNLHKLTHTHNKITPTQKDYGSGEDNQGSEAGSEEDQREIDIQNAFYEGEDMKDDLHGAMEKFESVVAMETSREAEGGGKKENQTNL